MIHDPLQQPGREAASAPAVPHASASRRHRHSRGFGLVEMLVAVGLMGAVVSMVFLTFFRARNEMTRIGTMVNARQSARATIQLIERDIRMSGSGWGKMAINSSASGTAKLWYALNPGPGGGINDSLRIIGAWSTATTTTASMGTATTAITCSTVTGFAVNDLIVITNGLASHMFQVTSVNTGTKQLLHATTSAWNVVPASWNWPPSGYASKSQIYKVDILTYSVDATNFRRPALVRRSFGGTPQVVTYELNNFQVWYRMQDGVLTRTPTVYGTGVALVDKVRPMVFTSLADPHHPTDVDSVWTEVRPRTF